MNSALAGERPARTEWHIRAGVVALGTQKSKAAYTVISSGVESLGRCISTTLDETDKFQPSKIVTLSEGERLNATGWNVIYFPKGKSSPKI